MSQDGEIIKAESMPAMPDVTGSQPPQNNVNLNIVELISKVGFPIVMVLMLFFWIIPKLELLVQLNQRMTTILEFMSKK